MLDGQVVVLAVDGNSLLHRAYHAGARTGLCAPDGRPVWAIQGLLSQLVSAVDRTCADCIIVGFDDPDSSERRQRWPDYKAQRPDKLATLDSQLREAPSAVAELGVPVVVPPGLEADDVLASVAASAPELGVKVVVATSDRDAFALIDKSTRVLRIINGGAGGSPLLTPERLETLVGVPPRQYRDLAALRGDPSDNLPGVPGVGRVTAAKLLAAFGSGQALFEAVHAEPDRVRAVVGPALTSRLADPVAQASWQRNCEIMTMRTDVPLDLDPHGIHRLPLSAARVSTVYSRYELAPGPAVTALAPGDPNPPDAGRSEPTVNGRERPVRRPRAVAPRQLTLFS